MPAMVGKDVESPCAAGGGMHSPASVAEAVASGSLRRTRRALTWVGRLSSACAWCQPCNKEQFRHGDTRSPTPPPKAASDTSEATAGAPNGSSSSAGTCSSGTGGDQPQCHLLPLATASNSGNSAGDLREDVGDEDESVNDVPSDGESTETDEDEDEDAPMGEVPGVDRMCSKRSMKSACSSDSDVSPAWPPRRWSAPVLDISTLQAGGYSSLQDPSSPSRRPKERRTTWKGPTTQKRWRHRPWKHQASSYCVDEAHLIVRRCPRDIRPLATQEMLMDALKVDPVCALLEDAGLQAIFEAMESYEFSAGEFIVQQGKIGTTFFIVETGSLEVTVNGNPVDILGKGSAFGAVSLLHGVPRPFSAKAQEHSVIWGASSVAFKRVLREHALRHAEENLRVIAHMRLFEHLQERQRRLLAEDLLTVVYAEGSPIISEGEGTSGIYFVQSGEVELFKSGCDWPVTIFRPGDCFGEQFILKNDPARLLLTVYAATRVSLVCISAKALQEVLGGDLQAALDRNLILPALRQSTVLSHLSQAQQNAVAREMEVKTVYPGEDIAQGFQFLVVLDGQIQGVTRTSRNGTAHHTRGMWMEDAGKSDGDGGISPLNEARSKLSRMSTVSLCGTREDMETDKVKAVKSAPCGLLALPIERRSYLTPGPEGARIAVLTWNGLLRALPELAGHDLGGAGAAAEVAGYCQKMKLVKRVQIFRHLSQDQIDGLVQSLRPMFYGQGERIIQQGTIGDSFFIIAKGEVVVTIDGQVVRTLGMYGFLGERALLFDEPRTATVEASSGKVMCWSLQKAKFNEIVTENMREELCHRIRLQDTNIEPSDLRCIRIVGTGAFGVVRLVQHRSTGTRYALKRIRKRGGQVPSEFAMECKLLQQMDHPFIVTYVTTFEAHASLYLLTELVTGGELMAAIRRMTSKPLTREHARFYMGSLVIILEELSNQNIIYRDLKPENVLLDQQGYLKLIDFGLAKRLDTVTQKAFTMVGTPHYMAPEVFRGQGYTCAVDLWSLGITMFELVCGELPFANDDEEPGMICSSILKGSVEFPPHYQDDDGRALILGLLAEHPKNRLGAGALGIEEIMQAAFFIDEASPGGDNRHAFVDFSSCRPSIFNRIAGRELEAPWVPGGEFYCDELDGLRASMSDADLFATD
eukprot:TRINITY_DN22763_c0_g1_i1.p1 TRINITY_DN22763_c0_g1~~TRINITY_DN22763_c0_g1_i1.p1  ORF type:complete len:1150 (-),score=192.39 TRINITY_DN22763_c0_g1_i1:307-3756(-)